MTTALSPEEAELKALEDAFTSVWDEVTYPFVLGDDPWKGEREKPWVRLSILPGQGDRADLGGSSNPLYEYPGVILVQAFVPQQGNSNADGPVSPQWVAAQLTQKVREIFQDQQFLTQTGGHLVCFATSYERIPQESSWVRFNIKTPYRRDEYAS